MSLADRRPQPPRRKPDIFFKEVNPAKEVSPLENLLQRELQEDRIPYLIEGLEGAHRNGDWYDTCALVDTLTLLVPGRIPSTIRDERFFNALIDLIEDQDAPSRPSYNHCFSLYFRTLETLFSDRKIAYEDLVTQRMATASRGLESFMERDRRSLRWASFYESAFHLVVIDPARRSSLPVTSATADGLIQHLEFIERNSHVGMEPVEFFRRALEPAAALAVLQPELKPLLPLYGNLGEDLESEFEQLRNDPIHPQRAFGQVASVLEYVALFTAERVDIPSPGKIILHSSAESLSPRQPLPIQPEYR